MFQPAFSKLINRLKPRVEPFLDREKGKGRREEGRRGGRICDGRNQSPSSFTIDQRRFEVRRKGEGGGPPLSYPSFFHPSLLPYPESLNQRS